jgi:16S rRNA (adenine1518-N6/adenine1519-N6)-dimethyltransferase
MQTKRQIQELLSSAGITPNRRLGQHFLVDLNLMRLLIDCAEIEPDDVVLEVGCGTGSMTEELAQRARRVVAVELDATLGAIAQERLAAIGNVELIRGDALASKAAFNPEVVEALRRSGQSPGGRLLLVSNLPYDVALPVILNLIQGPTRADCMVVTVQKEVADRMVASPRNKAYGTLSIFLGATSDVEIVRVLKPNVFWPPPGVSSAIVKVVCNAEKSARVASMDCLCQVVGLFMGHRRKMLRACIRHAPERMGNTGHWMKLFEQCQIDASRRPEELSAEQYVDLANCHNRLARREVSL